MSLARLLTTACRRLGHAALPSAYSIRSTSVVRRPQKSLFLGSTVVALAAFLAFPPPVIYSDASVEQTTEREDSVVDPATSIAFPKTIRVPAKFPIPPLTLIGVGVRTVSFIGIKVYSVALYADLANPALHVPRDLTPEQKIDHIVKNTACVIRIVPTRSTGYTHLRDAFTRALNARLLKARQSGELNEEQAVQEGSPIRKLSSLFPNSPFTKNTPLDIFLSAPQPGRPRALVFRDLGSVESDWVATNFVLNYFGPECPSPPLKGSAFKNIADFGK